MMMMMELGEGKNWRGGGGGDFIIFVFSTTWEIRFMHVAIPPGDHPRAGLHSAKFSPKIFGMDLCYFQCNP